MEQRGPARRVLERALRRLGRVAGRGQRGVARARAEEPQRRLDEDRSAAPRRSGRTAPRSYLSRACRGEASFFALALVVAAVLVVALGLVVRPLVLAP